MEPTAMCLLH